MAATPNPVRENLSHLVAPLYKQQKPEHPARSTLLIHLNWHLPLGPDKDLPPNHDAKIACQRWQAVRLPTTASKQKTPLQLYVRQQTPPLLVILADDIVPAKLANPR